MVSSTSRHSVGGGGGGGDFAEQGDSVFLSVYIHCFRWHRSMAYVHMICKNDLSIVICMGLLL